MNIDSALQPWRNGEVSDGEILRELILALHEVQRVILDRETQASEERFRKAGIIT